MTASSDEPRSWMDRWRRRLSGLDLGRWLVHGAALLPALWILTGLAGGGQFVNPYQAVEQRTGRVALILLILSLACSPANLIFGWRWALRHRRTLGLYAFAYAAIHLIILVALDYGFALRLLRADLSGKPFIWIGAASLLILAALAATSFPVWKKRLGRNWKRLHRLAYLAALLVIVHFFWARKGNLATLSGDVLLPLSYGLAVAGLLILRLPVIRRWAAARGRPAPPLRAAPDR